MLYNQILSKIEGKFFSLDRQQLLKYWAYAEARNRTPTLWLQVLAMLAWGAVLIAMDGIARVAPRILLLQAAGMVVGIFLVSLRSWLASGLIGKFIFLSAFSWGLSAAIAGSPDYLLWTLAIYALIVACVAPVYQDPLSFLACVALLSTVWLLPVAAALSSATDVALIFCFLVSMLVFSFSVNILFFRERMAVYGAQRKLIEMAFTDSLTRISNRRSFLRSLEETLERYSGQPELYFFMIDVDNFKAINDEHGHQMGDQVLSEIAARLEALASRERCGRLGGEEFGLFMLGEEQQARAMARQLNESVVTAPIHGLRTSISIGIARFTRSMSVNNLLMEADRQLYQAKNAGKNRYAMSTD